MDAAPSIVMRPRLPIVQVISTARIACSRRLSPIAIKFREEPFILIGGILKQIRLLRTALVIREKFAILRSRFNLDFQKKCIFVSGLTARLQTTVALVGKLGAQARSRRHLVVTLFQYT